jgi:hypothetical protein
MEPSFAGLTPLENLLPLLSGGVVAAAIGLAGAGIGVTLHAVRRRLLWRRLAEALGLRQCASTVAPLATPGLSGIYRGRALEAALLPSGQTRVEVRVANPRCLFDEIRADDTQAIAGALWLNPTQRKAIEALRDRLRRAGSVSVRGNMVTITAPAVGSRLDDLRALLNLAYGVAEGVDSATGAFIATPVRGRRRCAPGAATHRRA